MYATSSITAIEKTLNVSVCETLIIPNKSLETEPGADPKHLRDLFDVNCPTEIKMTADYKYFILSSTNVFYCKSFQY